MSHRDALRGCPVINMGPRKGRLYDGFTVEFTIYLLLTAVQVSVRMVKSR